MSDVTIDITNEPVTINVEQTTETIVIDNSPLSVSIANNPLAISFAETPVSVSLNQNNTNVIVQSVGLQGNPGASGATTPFILETDDNVLTGQPIYIKNTGHLGLAQANTTATSKVAGLVQTDTAPTFACPCLSIGKVARTDWTLVAGTVSLTIGAEYYLDPNTPGMITTIAPVSVTQIVVSIGNAVASDTLNIEIEQPILL